MIPTALPGAVARRLGIFRVIATSTQALGLVASLFALLSPSMAHGLDLNAFYLGSQRVIHGVILRVDARSIWYASLEGRVERVGRFEIVGLARYELPGIPMPAINFDGGGATDAGSVPLVRFETFHEGGRTLMAEGWPVSFDAEHIQVLGRDGREVLVPRDEIWGLESVEFTGRLEAGASAKGTRYVFRHPLAFEDYPQQESPGNAERLRPNETIQGQLALKKHFDALAAEYGKLEDYADRQRFYAQPHYYGNRTYLGTWLLLGSRNVNVGARRANLLPYVRTMGSSGPFSFQYEFVSGMAPRSWGVDAEPMAQTSFAMKDAYVGFDVYFDPTLVLTGSRYRWTKADLDPLDSRVIAPAGGRLGLDWKHVALRLGFLTVEHGVRNGESFERAAPSHSAIHLTLRRDRAQLEIGSIQSDFKMKDNGGRWTFQAYTASFESPLADEIDLNLRFFHRSLERGTKDPFRFKDVTQTTSAQVSWTLKERWRLEGLAILDRQRLESSGTGKGNDGADKNETKWHPKLGAGAALYF